MAEHAGRLEPLGMQVHRADDMDWETIRWPGQTGKMMPHPHADAETTPNAGLVRFLKGELQIGEARYGPGTMLSYPDPHFEEPLSTDTGGLMLFVQYPGPTTAAGRFTMDVSIWLSATRLKMSGQICIGAQ